MLVRGTPVFERTGCAYVHMLAWAVRGKRVLRRAVSTPTPCACVWPQMHPLKTRMLTHAR